MLSMIRIPNIHAGPTRSFAKSALILSVVLLMGNLSAIIDRFLHPDIPYFDDEHLIVGGFSALVTAFFITMLAIYVKNLSKGKKEIQALNRELLLKVEERTKQLVEAQEKLVREEKLAFLGLIAENMGNELRNPLAVMNNAVFFMKTVMPDADETIKEYLDIINNEIGNSQRIISDLLDFCRINTLRMEPVPVHELVRQGLEKSAIPENIQLQADIPEMLPAVRVDPLQMERVLKNLISNAVQAMPNGGELRIAARRVQSSKYKVQSSKRIDSELGTLNSEADSDLVEITVADTGEGISPENMDKLFQPLFSTRSRGIGLGLALSKKLTEANGGRMEVENRAGEGATFTVILPVAA